MILVPLNIPNVNFSAFHMNMNQLKKNCVIEKEVYDNEKKMAQIKMGMKKLSTPKTSECMV